MRRTSFVAARPAARAPPSEIACLAATALRASALQDRHVVRCLPHRSLQGRGPGRRRGRHRLRRQGLPQVCSRRVGREPRLRHHRPVDGHVCAADTPFPVLNSVTPSFGLSNVATPITLSGTGLRAGAKVIIGGVACANVQVMSALSLTCRAPILVATACHAARRSFSLVSDS